MHLIRSIVSSRFSEASGNESRGIPRKKKGFLCFLSASRIFPDAINSDEWIEDVLMRGCVPAGGGKLRISAHAAGGPKNNDGFPCLRMIGCNSSIPSADLSPLT